MRLRLLALGFALSATSATAAAQVTEEAAVLAAIERMFEGMRTADTNMVRSVLAPGARFAMLDTRATPVAVIVRPVDGWVTGIGGSNKRWDERIYDAQVRVDGNLAQAWTPYTFYLDKAVRHCGVNSIELLKDGAGWKITQISDTQRREGCRDVLAGKP